MCVVHTWVCPKAHEPHTYNNYLPGSNKSHSFATSLSVIHFTFSGLMASSSQKRVKKECESTYMAMPCKPLKPQNIVIRNKDLDGQ